VVDFFSCFCGLSLIVEWDDKCSGLDKSKAIEQIWKDSEVRNTGWGGVDVESSSLEEEGWPGVAIDDVWRPLLEEPGRTHGWASIPESMEVNVKVVAKVEECSACRC
jgi:hypothetical protein